MYDDKIIKQLYKKGTKFKGQNEYIVIEPSDGSFDDTFIGLNNSKERVKTKFSKNKF
jgi:RNase P protein component